MADDDFRVAVARFIAERGMTVGEFYEALGVDLESYRVDPDDVVAELAGIFKGWDNQPPE